MSDAFTQISQESKVTCKDPKEHAEFHHDGACPLCFMDDYCVCKTELLDEHGKCPLCDSQCKHNKRMGDCKPCIKEATE